MHLSFFSSTTIFVRTKKNSHVGVTALVNISGSKDDLGSLLVPDCDTKGMEGLAAFLKGKVRPMKMNKDKSHKKKFASVK